MAYGNTVKDGSGNFYVVLVDSQGRLVTSGGMIPSVQSDATANDSDKEFTVTASQVWEIKSIWVAFTSTATVGNRQIVVEFKNDSDVVFAQARAGATQAASLTRYYLFAPGVADMTSFRDTDFLTTPIPEYSFSAGYDIRVYDKAAIDAAADDMTLRMLIEYKTV